VVNGCLKFITTEAQSITEIAQRKLNPGRTLRLLTCSPQKARDVIMTVQDIHELVIVIHDRERFLPYAKSNFESVR